MGTFTVLWKYLICGLKFEISDYPTKLHILIPSELDQESLKQKQPNRETDLRFFYTSIWK